jgi:hypothetical protein
MLVVGPGQLPFNFNLFGTLDATLELSAPVSQNVAFSNGIGTLQLDNPASFTGSIVPSGGGDQIILSGVSFASVIGYSYSGDASGGTLTLQQSGDAITLKFLGNYNSGSFAYSAGPLPPSLLITVGGTGVMASLLNDSGGFIHRPNN